MRECKRGAELRDNGSVVVTTMVGVDEFEGSWFEDQTSDFCEGLLREISPNSNTVVPTPGLTRVVLASNG